MARSSVFISYRRDVDALRSAVLHLLINSTFNNDSKGERLEIFRDIRGRLGVDWPDEIRDKLTKADILLVVVGPGWLGAQDQHRRRRIDQPDDWVRQEIEMGLAECETVIPIAFENELPPADALPSSIRGLAMKQGTYVRDAFFADDLQPVLLAIEQHLGDGPSRTSRASSEERRLPWPDPPLTVTPAPLDRTDIDRALAEMITGWSVVTTPVPEEPDRSRVELYREFRFRSFRDVLRFMTDIGGFIDNLNHHPRWENVYETLYVYLTTWDIGHRISHLDIVLANHFDKTYADYTDPT